MVNSNFVLDVGPETRKEAIQQCFGAKISDTVTKLLECRLVCGDGGGLVEFE